MKKLLFFFIVFVKSLTVSVFAQVAPESPQVATLGKYVDVPVGNFTGTINVSIPIYEINVGDLKFPISISYNSSGIKVKEEASSVGLGWKLNAGGMITKIINGEDDFTNGGTGLFNKERGLGFANMNKSIMTNLIFDDYNQWKFYNREFFPEAITRYYLNKSQILAVDEFSVPSEEPPTAIGPYPVDLELFEDNDMQPDMYIYQIGNLFGKYMFGLDGNPYEVIINDVQINYDLNGFPTLVDPNGYKYTFGIKQTTGRGTKIVVDKTNYPPPTPPANYNPIQESSAGQSYTSGYYLTKITSPKGEEMDFYYTPVSYSNNDAPSKTIKKEYFRGSINPNITDGNEQLIFGSRASDYTALQNSLPDPDKPIITYIEESNTVVEQYLDSIVFRGGKINFKKAFREDIVNGVRLTEIEILSNTNGTNQLLKKFEFNNNQYYNALNTSSDPKSKRLKLNSITERGVIGTEEKTHRFYYDETPLPPKVDLEMSTSSYNANMTITRYNDAWGYYFGEKQAFLATTDVNEANMQMGILKQVFYPTGGHSSFVYEANNPKGGLRIKEILTRQNKNSAPLVKRYEYTGGVQYATAVEPFDSNLIYQTVSSFAGCCYVYTYIESSVQQTSGYTSMKGFSNGMHVGYNKVTEYSDYNSQAGKTEYIYASSFDGYISDTDYQSFLGIGYSQLYADISIGEPTFTFPSSFQIDPYLEQVAHGKLLKKNVYNSNADLAYTEEYEYNSEKIVKEFEESPVFLGSVSKSPIWSVSTLSTFGGGAVEKNVAHSPKIPIAAAHSYDFSFGNSDENNQWTVLGSVQVPYTQWNYAGIFMQNIQQYVDKPTLIKKKTYGDNQNFVENATFYNYSKQEEVTPYSIVEVSSKQDSIITEFTYTKGNPGFIAKNILHLIVAQEQELYDSSEMTYKLLSGSRTNYEIENIAGKDILIVDSIDNLEGGAYVVKDIYDTYDSHGNILEYHKKDGAYISVIWGYEKKYPIAKIENARYNDIASALGISETTLKAYNENNLSTISTLRSLLPNAMVSTYAYEPLIGMISMTDPKGIKTSYEYDDLNRLYRVKDFENNILSENHYNSIGPATDITLLTLSSYSLNFNSDGLYSTAITVNCNSSWIIRSKPSWIDTTISSGTNNSSFTVSCDPNVLTSPRNGVIVLESNGLIRNIGVSQDSYFPSPTITATPSNVVMFGSGTETISINSNTTWDIQKQDLDWIIVLDNNLNPITSGQGDMTINIMIDTNYSGSYDGGYLHFVGNGVLTSVYVELP